MLAVSGLLSASVSLANDTGKPWSPDFPENVEKIENLTYARYGERELKLDLYRPADSSLDRLPAVVVIRGGAWKRGDKESMGPMAAALASHGMVAVSIQYRPSTEAIFPAALLDTKAAVRWLRTHAADFSIDPDAIGATGQSAGGHLALLLGLTSGKSDLEYDTGAGDASSEIQAVVGFGAPVQFHTHPNLEPARVFFGAEFSENPEIWQAAAPITHVSSGAPPTLLMTGMADAVVPKDHPLILASAYQAHDVEIEVVLLAQAPHSFWNKERWFDYSIERAAGFFLRHLISDEKIKSDF